MSQIQDLRRRVSMSIVSATALSTALQLDGYRVAAIHWASGTTANAPLTFRGSQDGSSYFPLWDENGSEITIASGAFSTAQARSIAIGPTMAVQLGAHKYVRFCRGLSTAEANVGATAAPFDVILTPW